VSARVSAVIVSWNTRAELLQAIASLDGAVPPVEVLVVDNASSDGSAGAVRERFPAATVIENAENRGFGAAANQGLRAASAPYVLLLNSDATLQPGALAALSALLDTRPEMTLVAPRTRYEDGAIQVSWGDTPGLLAEWKQRRLVLGTEARDPRALRQADAVANHEHEPAWLSASCWLARRDALLAVGLFDEAFFLYWEDVDLCLRLRAAGFRLLFTPAAEIVHRQGVSRSRSAGRALAEYHRSHLRFYRKHGKPAAAALLWLAQRLRGIG
jgi:N-acetylglucosaminyl-diphospho-decaprenol L-rhamnosyltransferase